MDNKIEVEIEEMGNIVFEKLRDDNKNKGNMPIKQSKIVKTIYYDEFKRMLDNEYLLSLLRKRKKIRIFKSNAVNLISKYRYDVFVKYYYVQAYITKNNYGLAKKIYLDNIKSFNNFREPDGRKKGPEDFIDKFDELIDNIKINGNKKTIIPVTKNGEIIDGSHRLAISLYLKLDVEFAIFDLLDVNYGKEFFLNRGFKREYSQIIDEEVIRKYEEGKLF